MPGRPLLFYSQWPLGFFNPEGEHKAFALGDAGYDVVYVPGIGIRNPRLARARKALNVGLRKLRHRSGASRSGAHAHVRTGSLLVLPPRQVSAVRRLNVAWVRRQLQALIPSWDEAIAWIRYPTPELVEALALLRPRAVVYECVDAYQHTPGIVGGWEPRFERAERALVGLADLVVVPSEALAERLAPLGPAGVRVVPHGVNVDLFPWRPPDRREPGPITVGFVGTLDMRIDIAALRFIADRHRDWRIRLMGKIGDGFDPASVTDCPNITVEPVVPQARLGEVIASFDAGLMPYLGLHFKYMCPVKNLEFMAAGKPAVARPNQALMRYEDILYFAETPAEFCAQLERALSEDSVELARRRRAVAEANRWERRLDEIKHLAMDLAGP